MSDWTRAREILQEEVSFSEHACKELRRQAVEGMDPDIRKRLTEQANWQEGRADRLRFVLSVIQKGGGARRTQADRPR